MSTTTKSTAKTAANAVANDLKTLLADSYALLAQTHLAHWNVEGPDFFQLHTAFQSQYEELFTAITSAAWARENSPPGQDHSARLIELLIDGFRAGAR